MHSTIPALLALVMALGASGCGAGDRARSVGTTTTTALTPQALTQSEVMGVQLRTPRAQALARLGPPSATGPQEVKGHSCLYWRIANQPPTALWRLCFRSGRLQILSTYLS